MRILMLGWEFPPFIAGGLGVACHGLTRALDRMGHEITFVLPRPVDQSVATHVRLLSPGTAVGAVTEAQVRALAHAWSPEAESANGAGSDFANTTFWSVPAAFSHPYPQGNDPVGHTQPVGAIGADAASIAPGMTAPVGRHGAGVMDEHAGAEHARQGADALDAPIECVPGATYGDDLIGDAARYAQLVAKLAAGLSVDVVHAHDWLAYPAGIAAARLKHVPLVVHVHATEFDRSGEHVNQPVYDLERRGMHVADRVIAVSMLTKSLCAHRYGVRPAKIDVVYNGIDDGPQPSAGETIRSRDRIVLFLGRLTMQKGPEYFIRAAARVLEKVQDVKFVVAGSGDMARAMIEQATELGIDRKVLFTGFLHRRDVARIYRMADCYVMPSVSEPFGLVALEAIQHDVPAIISRQSGASEVLTHVLKVDFWDVDEIANKIIAVLRHPPLGQALCEHGAFELRSLTWDGAARKCVQSYHAAGVKAL